MAKFTGPSYQVNAGDWQQIEIIINDLASRFITQALTPESSPTFAGLTIDALSGILKGTTGIVGTATAGVDYEVPLTFSDSLNRTVNTINLDGDSNAPGNSYYYGTNELGAKGFYTIASAGGTIDHSTLLNLDYASAGHTGFEPTVSRFDLSGTENQVILTGSGLDTLLTNDITLSLPQDIHTAASPTFANLNLPTTTISVGRIIQNSQTVFHTYVPSNQAPTFNNIFIGVSSGNFSLNNSVHPFHGTGNVGIGTNSLDALTTGFYNFALGTNAGSSITTGSSNTLIGHQAGLSITTGQVNCFIGRDSGVYNSTGADNFALGENALREGTNNQRNIAIGNLALNGVTGNSRTDNVAIGHNAGLSNTTGSSNIFIGRSAGYRQTTASNLLIFDNQQRADIATEITNSILYGVMGNIPASQTLSLNAVTTLSQNGTTIGIGDTGVDYTLTFDGETNDGVLTWLEDEDYFLFSDDILMNSTEAVMFNDTSTKLQYSGGDLDLYTTAEKTLELQTVVWNDINMSGAVLAAVPGQQPGRDEFVDSAGTDTGIDTYALAVGEAVDGCFEIMHDYKEGTDLTFHIHWQGIAAPTGTDNVRWELTYILSREETVLAAATSIEIETAFDTQYEFKRSNFAAITGTNFKIGDQFLFKVERIASTGDAYAGEALLATLGIHYQINTIGSRTINAK